jgi:hypothetical protein
MWAERKKGVRKIKKKKRERKIEEKGNLTLSLYQRRKK